MEKRKVLEVNKISKEYNSVTVLQDFSININSGEVHALIGHNGAGKSTVIRMLSGSELPTRGNITINGQNVQLTSPSVAKKYGIYTVFQELHLIEEMTVSDNIFLGQEINKYGFVNRKKMHHLAEQLLQEFHVDKFSVDTKIKELSHAQKQMVEIITALHNNADLILLDEPTTALEQDEINNLLDTMKKLTKRGVSFLFITHKLDEAFAVSDYVTVLRNGKTVLEGSVNKVSKDEVIQSVVGKELGNDSTKKAYKSKNDVVFKMEEIKGDLLNGVNFTVHQGEVVGLYGLVGAGRTEVLETIFGVRKFSKGQMEYLGKEFKPKNPIQAIRSGIRYLTEERKKTGIIPQMDGRMNMVLANLKEFQRFGFVDKKRIYDKTEDYLSRLSIKGDLSSPVVRLSGGNQQKVLLARWLMLPGKLLLLDEPTKGVDIGVKTEMHAIIRDLAEQGYSIIVVSSEVEEIINVSDTIVVLAEGRSKERVFDGQTVTEDQLLIEAMEV